MNNIKDIDWKKELTNNVTSVDTLVDLGYINKENENEIKRITNEYPMSVTRYYLSLIEKNDYTDPIYKMCIASADEAMTGGKQDTSGEMSNTIFDGIQHKYDNTVLLLSTNVCAMYCRHCFRKRLVGQSEDEILKFTNNAIEYIKNRPEVDNVLITGGDAFLNTNKIIKCYLEGLTKIDHIKFIRFGTRTPVVFPQRIYGDSELINMLYEYGKKKTVYVVTQFNHPKELTKEALRATDLLRQAGVPVLNQTVLLKGVNDNENTLAKLFNALAQNGISPYYLFQCRPVKGVKGLFAVPLIQACEIVDKTRIKLSGIAKRFRYAMSHIKGKLEIIGLNENNELLLKQHQAKNNNDLNNFYTVKVDNNSYWLTDDLSKPL